VVLVFVGAKMLLTDIYKIPIALSLGVIATILATSIIASLLFPKAAEDHAPVEHDPLERGKPEPVVAPIPREGAID
jgi:tellurite resistance protein TerC